MQKDDKSLSLEKLYPATSESQQRTYKEGQPLPTPKTYHKFAVRLRLFNKLDFILLGIFVTGEAFTKDASMVP